MLKQAIPPIVGGSHGSDKSAGGPVYPPFNNLPQWPRVNTLARSCPPKPLLKDRLTRLPDSSSDQLRGRIDNIDDYDSSRSEFSAKLSVTSSPNTDRRVHQLEHNIAYLTQLHSELLQSLHEEIDKLKRENRDLQFKLTMADGHLNLFGKNNVFRQKSTVTIDSLQSNSPSVTVDEQVTGHPAFAQNDDANHVRIGRPSNSRRPSGTRSKADLQRQVHSLESEVLDLRDTLREEKQKNVLLEEQLERVKSANGSYDSSGKDIVSPVTQGPTLFTPRPPAQPRSTVGVERHRRSSATGSDPGHVISQVPKILSDELMSSRHSTSQLQQQQSLPPTVAECHELIRQLRMEYNTQALELNQLKSDLRESIKSSATTLAKTSHTAESDTQPRQQHRILHKSHARKIAETLYSSQDLMLLPSVKISLADKAVDRHSRRLQQRSTRPEHEMVSSHDISDSR